MSIIDFYVLFLFIAFHLFVFNCMDSLIKYTGTNRNIQRSLGFYTFDGIQEEEISSMSEPR